MWYLWNDKTVHYSPLSIFQSFPHFLQKKNIHNAHMKGYWSKRNPFLKAFPWQGCFFYWWDVRWKVKASLYIQSNIKFSYKLCPYSCPTSWNKQNTLWVSVIYLFLHSVNRWRMNEGEKGESGKKEQIPQLYLYNDIRLIISNTTTVPCREKKILM